MPEEEHPRKANWVEKWSAFVLTITMGAAVFYAYEAKKQSASLNENVTQQTRLVEQQMLSERPVLMAHGALGFKTVPNQKDFGTAVEGDVVPDGVQITVANFGKSVAVDTYAFGHLMLTNQGAPPPIEPKCEETHWPQKDEDRTAVAQQPYGGLIRSWTVLPGQDISEVSSGKDLYAVGCVYYRGLDRATHYSDICLTWARGRGNNPFQPCQDSKRNYIH